MSNAPALGAQNGNPGLDRILTMSVESFVNKFWHRVAAVFRKKRRRELLTLFPPEKFASVIDVGGIAGHWTDDPRAITVLNLMPQPEAHCKVIVGDGRHTAFPDRSFDLAYSNSAIEHVGRWKDQAAFAAELRRIGKAVYCQTPNRWFPLEVHYLTCFLHWYPKLLRNYFIARFMTGWGWLVRPDRKQAEDYANSVSLLSYSQVQELFPDCKIDREKFLGMTKSLIAIRYSPAVNSGTTKPGLQAEVSAQV